MDAMEEFANTLSARMLGTDVKTYIETHDSLSKETALARIEKMIEQVKVKTLADYKEAMKLKSVLSSLFCFTFNNNRPEWKRVAELESRLGKKLLKFARSYKRIKDKRLRAIAKYMITCWSYYFSNEDVDAIVDAVVQAEILYQKDGQYLITGLHYAVGDNTFTVGRNGKQYRDYIETCALQAFYVNWRWQKILEARKVDAPPLPDFYEPTCVAPNQKYCARVYLSEDQYRLIPRKQKY